MFVGKAWSLPQSGEHEWCFTQALSANNRLGWKDLHVPNTPTYYEHSYMKVEKSFVTWAPEYI